MGDLVAVYRPHSHRCLESAKCNARPLVYVSGYRASLLFHWYQTLLLSDTGARVWGACHDSAVGENQTHHLLNMSPVLTILLSRTRSEWLTKLHKPFIATADVAVIHTCSEHSFRTTCTNFGDRAFNSIPWFWKRLSVNVRLPDLSYRWFRHEGILFGQ